MLGLRANRARTLLAVLGVAVSAAMLLDMVMLATGMRESFRRLLTTREFQIRLAPKGTLPFDTEATIGDASRIVAQVAALDAVVSVNPVLGGQAFFARPDGGVITAAALGTGAGYQGEYDVVEGRAPVGVAGSGEIDRGAPPSGAIEGSIGRGMPTGVAAEGSIGASTSASLAEVVVSDDLLAALGANLGDTVRAAAGYDPQLRSFTGERRLVIVGRARFLYTAAGQRVVGLPLSTLQSMDRTGRGDAVSLIMVRLRPEANVDSLRAVIEALVPAVTAVSIDEAIRQVDQRLSYFRQLAVILGAVSLVVGFLLVTTIVTVTVNERVGEIAVLRAIGVTRGRVVRRVSLEGLGLVLAGSVLGLGLGLVTARYLNSILASFPGLPEAIDFFLFQPRAALTSLGLLLVAGALASIYPAWRAASLPIASTLREEAVG